MNIPSNLKYTKEHEWVLINADGTVKVGITDFAQNELGDIVFLDIDTEGDEVGKDEVFGTIEAVKTVSDLYMPVSGEVIEVNPALDEEPNLVNSDPYGEGWMVIVKVQDPDELDDLLSDEDYKKIVGANS